MSIRQGNNIIAGSNISIIEKQDPTAQNNYTWYRKYADGWVEQGGIIETNIDAAHTNNLLVTMADTNYTVLVTREGTGHYGNNINGAWNEVYNKTTTTFTTWGKYGSISTKLSWQVSGMAA